MELHPICHGVGDYDLKSKLINTRGEQPKALSLEGQSVRCEAFLVLYVEKIEHGREDCALVAAQQRRKDKV